MCLIIFATLIFFIETTFTVNIISENPSSTPERILSRSFAMLLPSSEGDESPGDVVEHGSLGYITQDRLNKIKQLKQVRDIFASHGAIITDMAKGSLRLNAVVTTLSQLERIHAAYESGYLEKKMSELMITDETTRIAGCKVTLKLNWNSQEFYKGQEFFGK